MSPGMADITALQPNWSATITRKEEDSGMTLWTEMHSTPLNYSIHVNLGDSDISVHCQIRHEILTADMAQSKQRFFGYNTNMGGSFFPACLRWFEQ